MLLAEDILYVGLTSEALLTKKTNKPLLQSYNLRQHILKEYVRSLKPTLRIEVS